jgi:GntR family transcriptional regulator
VPRIEPSKTQRIYLNLRHRIVTGEIEPGARLPSEPDLAALHRISRVTVRRALDQLEREGLVLRTPGAGTFAASGGVRYPMTADLANALAHLGEMGRTSAVRLLAVASLLPPAAIATALRLAPGTRVQRSVRIRSADGEPFSYLVTYVPDAIAATYSEQDLASTPLLTLLERSNVRVERATQTIGATLASPETADALAVDIGAPLITLTRVVFDDADNGVEYLQAFYPPDRYSFRLELVRSGGAQPRRWHASGAADGASNDERIDA